MISQIFRINFPMHLPDKYTDQLRIFAYEKNQYSFFKKVFFNFFFDEICISNSVIDDK